MKIEFTIMDSHRGTGIDGLHCMWFGRYSALAVVRRDQGNLHMARFYAQQAREALRTATIGERV